MATILGREGTATVDGSAVAELRSFKLTIAAGSTPTNTMQSGEWDKSRTGRKNWNAEIEAYYDPSDTNGQLAFVAGAEVELDLYPDDDDTGNERRTGTGRVDEITISGSGEGDDLFEFSAKITGIGEITKGTAT